MKNIIIAATIIGMDQLAKCCIRYLPIGVSCFELSGILRITHYTNTGAAFSIFSEHTMLLAAASLLLMTGIVIFAWRKMNLTKAALSAYACLIGGGLSNLVDRICFGGVTDYIEMSMISFPVFNLADVAITLSIAALLLMTLMGKLEITTGEDHGGKD